MKCSNCGLANLDHVAKCVKCGQNLDESNSPSNIENLQTYPPRANKFIKSIRNIFYKLNRDIGKVPDTNSHASYEERDKSSFLAELYQVSIPSLVSVIPGLGHWKHGRRFIAEVIFFLYVSCLVLGIFFYGSILSNIFFGMMISIHAISIFDVYNLNWGNDFRHRLHCMALIVIVIFSGYYLAYRQITSRVIGFRIPFDYLAPEIKLNDFVLATRRSTYQRGQLVFFSRERMQARLEMFVEHGNFVDKIIACPEDTVLIRGNTIYINGGKLAEDKYPINRTAYLQDMEVKLGKGEYFIYPSTLNRLDRLGPDFLKEYSTVNSNSLRGLTMIYAPLPRMKFLDQ